MSVFYEMLGRMNKGIMDPVSCSLDSLMTRQLNRFLVGKSPERLRMDLYVTDFYRLCLRRMVLKILKPVAADQIPADLQKLFDAGTAIHDWWQNKYYGPMGILIGDWECPRCDAVQNGTMPKDPCAGCGKYLWKYRETRVQFEAHGLTLRGRVDGILTRPDNVTPMILEMKTSGPSQWSEIQHPSAEHVLQASVYAECLELTDIFVSYINRDTWRTKDYVVQKSRESVQWVSDTLGKVAEIVDGDRNVEAAPRACKNASAAKRRGCGYAAFCFA